MNFLTYHEKRKKEVNDMLVQFLSEQRTNNDFLDKCYDVIREYTLRGGKRLRPVALLMAYESFKKDNKALLASLAVELHHTYSLILDDIMDEDSLRRNKPTVHMLMQDFFKEGDSNLFSSGKARYGVSFGIMLGNLTNIFSKRAIMQSDFSNEINYKSIRLMEKADELIYRGQMLDINFEVQQPREDEYMEMIKLKTAVLFGVSFQLGGLFAGKDEHIQDLLWNFGVNSAMAFQIQDDIIDITSGKGHDIGSDIKKGKNTLLIIKAMEKCSVSERKLLRQAKTETEIRKAIEIIHTTGAVEYCRKVADKKIREAKTLLNNIEKKELFFGFADYMLSRKS